MQAAKIKVGEVYAYWRGSEYVRYAVDAKITRNEGDRAQTTLEGRIIEDGRAALKFTLSPEDLKGPYQEVAELVERKAKEDAKRAATERDRLTLYRFVGVKPPKGKDYDQPFRASYGSVDIRQAGVRLLIEKIEKLEAEKKRPTRAEIDAQSGPSQGTETVWDKATGE